MRGRQRARRCPGGDTGGRTDSGNVALVRSIFDAWERDDDSSRAAFLYWHAEQALADLDLPRQGTGGPVTPRPGSAPEPP
jgi:hypothetical protein